MTVETMRQRFARVTSQAVDEDPRLALVLADIGVDNFAQTGLRDRHPARVINVGIREQLMIGVAAGLAQEGLRPVVHSYAPFLVERPFEQIKLDLGHQDVGAVLVSIGASYDASPEGRTHQAPGDVALLATVPGFAIHVPGHPDEVEQLLRREFARDGRAYVRLSAETNAGAWPAEQLSVVREGSAGSPLVLAIGPTLDEVLAATADLDVDSRVRLHGLAVPRLRGTRAGERPQRRRRRRAVSGGHFRGRHRGRAPRPPASPSCPRRAAVRAPPLRPARGAPQRLRPRCGRHPPLARRLPHGCRGSGVSPT